MYSLPIILKNITKKIDDCYIKVTDTTIINRIKNKINDSINQNNQTISKKIQEESFCNLPPKIGYFDEKTVPLYSNYNMSWIPQQNFYITSDMEGRETVYFLANTDASGYKVFKALRSNINNPNGYAYENEPVILNNAKIDQILGIGNDFIIVKTNNKWYKFSTNYSSNINNWNDSKDISSIVKDTSYYIYYFSENNYYLVCERDYKNVIFNVYDENLSLISSTTVFDLNNVFDSKDKNHKYNTYLGAISVAYVPEKQYLVVYCGECPRAGYEVDDNGKVLWSNTTDAEEWLGFANVILDFTPDKLENSNCFKSPNWNVPIENFYDYQYWGGKFRTRGPRGSAICFYDKLNRQFYMSKHFGDNPYTHIIRMSIDEFEKHVNQKMVGYDLVYANGVDILFFPPDTSPWAKMLYHPSMIYDSFILEATSKKYGDRRKILCTLENSKEAGYKSITAGSWTIDMSQTFYSWDCSCTKKGNNVTWYTAKREGNEIKIYELIKAQRTDQRGEVHNDKIIAGTVVMSIDISAFPVKGFLPTLGRWLYDSDRKEFITLTAASGNRSVHLENDAWVADDENAKPALFVFKEDGSYKKIPLDNAWIFCSYYIDSLQKRYNFGCGSGAPNGFLDLDNKSAWISFGVDDGHGRYGWWNAKIKLNSDNSSVTYAGSIPGYLTWHGNCSTIGWNSEYGYYATIADWNYAYIFSSDNEDNAFCRTGTMYKISCKGSLGLIAYLQPTPIFLGGYFSIVAAQEIYLKANSDNYIYLSRDDNDYTKVNVELYDHMLDSKDKSLSINFSRILISKILTDNIGPISQEYYPVDYYGA